MLPALLDKFPRLAEPRPAQAGPLLPHRPLGQFPTAIERVPGALAGGAELWVKREDQSGALYGGNKVRRLEFLLAGAVPEVPTRLLTFGGYASNHVLATGIYGKLLGYSVEAVLYPQPVTPNVGTALASQLGAGIRQRICRTYFGVPGQLLAARRSHPATRFIAPGGIDISGTLGWWSGGLEIAAQVAAGVAPAFDAVYVALGSGDTTAGLLLGLGAATKELVGVRVVPWPVASATGVRLLARRTARQVGRMLGSGQSPRRPALPPGPSPKLRVEGRFLGGGYGHPTPWGAAAITAGAQLGLRLDPTYTGKVFAALLEDARSGRLAGKRVLFVHTYNGRDTSELAAAGDLSGLPAWLTKRLADTRRDVG